MAGIVNETLQKQDLTKLSKMETANKELRSKLSVLIKSTTFKQTYFLYGEEDYLIRYYKNALVKAIVGDMELNITEFEGAKFDKEEFRSVVDTLPFFSEKRVVVLSNTGLFGKKPELDIEKLKLTYTDEEIAKMLEDFDCDEVFENIPESTILIITDRKVAKNRKLVKNLLKNGEAFEINYQEPQYVKGWIAGWFMHSNVQLTRAAASLLVDRIGVDMNTLIGEADKLISYTTNGVVDVAEVEAITSDRFENRVFKMLEFAVSGNMNGAFDAYKDILALNGEPIAIFVMMGKQIDKYLAALEIYNKTRNSNEVYKRLGVGYFNNVARYLNKEKLEKSLERYIELDRSIKEGNMDVKLAPELLIAYLAD